MDSWMDGGVPMGKGGQTDGGVHIGLAGRWRRDGDHQPDGPAQDRTDARPPGHLQVVRSLGLRSGLLMGPCRRLFRLTMPAPGTPSGGEESKGFGSRSVAPSWAAGLAMARQGSPLCPQELGIPRARRASRLIPRS